MTRKLEVRDEGGIAKAYVDGKLVPGVTMDLKAVRQGIKTKTIYLAMYDNMIKGLRRKLEDFGPNLKSDEILTLTKAFEKLINE